MAPRRRNKKGKQGGKNKPASPKPGENNNNDNSKELEDPRRVRAARVALEPYRGEHELDFFVPLITQDLSEPYSVYTYRYFLHGWPQLCFLAWDDAPKDEPLTGYVPAGSGSGSGASAGDAGGEEARETQQQQQQQPNPKVAAAGADMLKKGAAAPNGGGEVASAGKARSAGDAGDGAWPLWDEPLGADGRRCVGSVIAKLDRHKRGPLRGYIAMLAVHPAYRKCGLATRLVERCVAAMTEELCEEVVLETEVKNKGAMGLYESLGFLREKRLVRYYMNGGDAFRLRMCIVQAQDRLNIQSEAQQRVAHAEAEQQEIERVKRLNEIAEREAKLKRLRATKRRR
jgi:ribosomal protein S18 acetylase RimI-like enzyme